MSLQLLAELQDVDGDSPSRTRIYAAPPGEYATREEARAAAAAEIPESVDGLRIRTQTMTSPDEGIWRWTVTYGPSAGTAVSPDEDTQWSTDLGTVSQKITHGIALVEAYGVAPPDFGAAINVRRAGKDRVIDGTEIAIPVMIYRASLVRSASTFDGEYLRQVAGIVGRVNSTAVLLDGVSCDAGEVLLMSARMTPLSGNQRRMDYEFGFSPNQTDLEVETITGIDKLGWDLLWAYSDLVSGDTTLGQAVTGAYVVQIYERADFEGLIL